MNAKTGKKPAKRSAGADSNEDDGSSSDDSNNENDNEDVKPPAVTTKKAKREVKAEVRGEQPRRTAGRGACIEIVDDDDSDY